METMRATRKQDWVEARGMDDLFKEIDRLELGERLLRWKEARRNAPWRVGIEREKLALQSWKETEGEDIETRRAKLLKEVLEGVPIEILDFDLIVGRVSKGLISASTAIDVCGDYIPGLWEDEEELDLNLTVKGALSRQDRAVLRESARHFHRQSATAHVTDAWRKAVGTWVEDCMEAKGYDPAPSTGFFPGTVGVPEWGWALAKGLRGFINDAQAKIERFKDTKQTDIDRLYFWQAVIIVCEAAIAYAHRYAKLARERAEEEQNQARKNELLEIARVCEWVPENPPRTFHEAVQSLHFMYLCRTLEHPLYAPNIGRADQYLWPYFKKDFDSGNLTLERAAELLESAIGHWGSQTFVANAEFREHHQISYGINLINVGGVDKDGKDVSNLLSYLLLHAVGLMRLSAPSVGVQWHRNIPRWLMDKAIDTNIKTKGGIPLFENGDHVTERFVAEGIPLEEARNWYGLGCVTPVVLGRVEHNGAEGTGSVNIPFIFDVVLHNGVSAIAGKQIGLQTGDPRTFKTFEDLYDAFKKQCDFVITRVLWLASIARRENEKYARFPFQSMLLAKGCMENGEDVTTPNPSYHSFALGDRGIIDTADSLLAIKKLVFDEKRLTMAELMDALDSNFRGARGEEIRQMCLAAPKFGNDMDEADMMARDVGIFTASVILSYDNSPCPRFRVVREGLSWHYFGGLGVGALPNGRKSQEPLNDGSMSPMRGMDTCGPTGVLRSVLKAGFNESHASALNQKFSASTMRSPESKGKLAVLTDTFLKQGGQHIQFNLVDAQELRDAKTHPENHKDLVVRIGGFSAYFVQLTPEIQDDVINRSEQGLC